MASLLQIRRGESLTGSLQSGELYYDITSQSLALGSNIGSNIQLAKIGAINSGSFNVSGDITLGGTITIGDTTNDSVIFNADLSSSIIPDATNIYDLGSTSKVYRTVYATSGSFTQLTGTLSGSINGIGNITTYSTSVDSRIIINSQSAWGAFQSASSYSSSFYSTINNATQSILINSQSAWGAFQSASSYSASFYTTINTNIDNIASNSASAWGAFQSASAYSASLQSSILIVSESAWGAFQSASAYSASAVAIFATTGSNTFNGSQIISGNVDITGKITAFEIHTIYQSSSVIFSSGSQTFGDQQSDKVSITGSLEVTGSTNFIELSGSLATYSQSVDSRISASNAITNLYSSSFYTTINNTTESVLINSQSAWGAFQSASAYSASLQSSILIISESAWGAFQSASAYSSSFSSSLSATSGALQTSILNISTSVSNLSIAAGANTSANNTFTGYNTFTQYITGSISGAVDGIDVRDISSSFNSRISISVANVTELSASIYQTDVTQSNNILINSASAWGAFQSASSYSSSFATSISESNAARIDLSSSVATTDTNQQLQINSLITNYVSASVVTSLSTSVDSRLDSLEFNDTTFATTGSNTFKANQIISGSLNVTNDITASGNLFVSGTIYATELHTIIQSSSVIFSSGSNQIGDQQGDILTITGSLNQTGSTSFSELSGSLFAFSASLNSRFGNIGTDVNTLSASIYQTDVTQSNNILINSASAWGAFQSASAYSASAATVSITNANSAAGALASASAYSASAVTTYAKLAVANTFTQNQIISGSLNVTGDVVAYATSDERLKNNIQLISNPIQKVNELRGVEFDWKDGMPKAGQHEYGVIAQDVLKVMPELVNQRQDGYYAVDYDKIVGLLIEVVKEQEKRIKELENKIV